jgi:hypothetical protein
MNINYSNRSLVKKFDAILERGLCVGVGSRDGQMCIEAAICAVLDLPHSDTPSCVEPTVRVFKIRLNDANWSSPTTRAKGLRDLGLAQIGSYGVVQGREFSKRVAEQTIRILIPKLFRKLFPGNSQCLAAANRCEQEGTAVASYAAADAAAAYVASTAAAVYVVSTAAYAASTAAYAASAAAYAAADAAYAADDAGAAYAAADAASASSAAAYAAADAAYAADDAGAASASSAAYAADDAYLSNFDEYLLLSASIALQVLRDLNSPGCAFLE